MERYKMKLLLSHPRLWSTREVTTGDYLTVSPRSTWPSVQEATSMARRVGKARLITSGRWRSLLTHASKNSS